MSSYVMLRDGCEYELTEAIATKGPVTVVLGVVDSFMLYKDGIYYDDNCSEINHALTAVGYSVAENGEEYYIVKNSWGPNWGNGGYVNIARNMNTCRISDYVVYPVV